MVDCSVLVKFEVAQFTERIHTFTYHVDKLAAQFQHGLDRFWRGVLNADGHTFDDRGANPLGKQL
jgi:hypothetical protein